MSFKRVFKDLDYVQSLTKEERAWLKKALTGTQNATKKWLMQINEEKAEGAYRQAILDREARRRDMFTNWVRVDNEQFSQGEYGKLPSVFEGETTVNNFEDAMIEKIDNERMHGKPYSMGSYGNNEDVPVGADVVICIEGHALQNRLGKVTAKRRGQYMVEIQTTKGDVTIFVSAHEIARVNTMKQVAG